MVLVCLNSFRNDRGKGAASKLIRLHCPPALLATIVAIASLKPIVGFLQPLYAAVASNF